jgi:hypothetical protein
MLAHITLFLFFFSTLFFFWGIFWSGRAGSDEHKHDLSHLIKTFWILFFCSIFWFLFALVQVYAFSSGIIYQSTWLNAFGWHFIISFFVAWKAYVFNEKVKDLKNLKK